MTTSPWFEDPAFWAAMRPALFSAERVAAAPSELDAIDDLVRRCGGGAIGPGTRVVDMPCGVGRHSIELARRGAAVTAVDLTEAFLDVGRKTAAEVGAEVEFVHADMRTLDLPEARYDLGLNLFTSLGYSGDEADDLATLGNFARALVPGGLLVVDLFGKEILARIFQPKRYSEIGGYVVHEKVEILDDWQSVRVEFCMERDGDRRTQIFHHRIYAASDLIRMLTAVGFVDVRCFGQADGRPYDHEAERLVVVAVRGEGHPPTGAEA